MVPYDEKGELVRDPGLHPTGGKSLTKQSDASDADVNKVVNRYVTHGVVPPLNGRRAEYGDFTRGGDFTSMYNAVAHAMSEFEALPSAVRDACRNDPAIFLDKVFDAEARRELEALGLPATGIPEDAPGAPPVADVGSEDPEHS